MAQLIMTMNSLRESVKDELFKEADEQIYQYGFTTQDKIEEVVDDVIQQEFNTIELSHVECREFINNDFKIFDAMVEEINEEDIEIQHLYTLSKVVNLWRLMVALHDKEDVVEVLYDTYKDNDDDTIEAVSESEDEYEETKVEN